MTFTAIPREEFERRLEAARELTASLRLDALLVVGRAFYDRPGNLAYLTNYFPPEPTMVFGDEVRGAGHGILLLPRRGAPILFTAGAVPEHTVIDDVRPTPNLGKALVTALEERRLTAARIGVAGGDLLPLSLYLDLRNGVPAVDWVCVDPALDMLRRVKSPVEQHLLREAVRVADRAHAAARDRLAPGVTESQVAAAGVSAALAEGADFVRYFRVHGGADTAHLFRWPPARPQPFRDGEMVLLDIIGAYRGYGFDIMRTTVVGKASPEQQRLLRAVAAAVDAMLRVLRAGITVDALVREGLRVLEAQGYGRHARSFLGHGIGLETVEFPYLIPGNTTVLQANEVLCIEPSVVIPGWGGAGIERQVVVTEDGCEVLDTTPVIWEG